MYVLALDTATETTSVAVVALESGPTLRIVAAASHTDARAHGEVLAPLLAQCLAGLPEPVAAVVVGVGPGPFTGLRVGLVTAAVYGHARGLPVHGVCSLDALGRHGPCLAVTDARRREIYHAAYDAAGRRVAGPAVARPGAVAAQVAAGELPAGGRLVGPTASRWADEFPGLTAADTPLDPAALVAVAAADLLAGRAPGPLVPRYLRHPDAVPQPAAVPRA